ncbi:MAG TPA: GNVR domain-containing protein [bacterium]
MIDAQNKTNIDIRAYWQIFWRRKFFFIIPLLLSIIAGVVMILVSKPVYESSSVVQVNQGQLLSREMQRLIPGVTVQERLDNLRRLITSHDYLLRLVQSLNLYDNPEMKAKAAEDQNKYPGLELKEVTELLWIDQLKRFLTIRQVGTDFIQISAYALSRDLAYNFAKTLTQIFIDESLRREVGGIRGALEFGTEQLIIYKQKLEESEERLRKYKQGIVQESIGDQAIISTNLDQVKSMLMTTEFELKETRDRLSFLGSRIKSQGFDYKIPNTSRLQMLKIQLLDANVELSKLLLQYSWNDVKILKIIEDIDNLRSQLRNEIESEIKTKYATGNGADVSMIQEKEITAMEVEYLQQRQKSLINLQAEYTQRLSQGPSREMALNRLTREVEANREIYQSLMQQTQGSEIEQALQRTAAEFKFKIVEPAIKPIKPVKPDRIKMMLMAIVVGAIIGGGLIFLLEYMDHSFKNVEDIEKYLNLPVLGTIPKIEISAKL